MDFPPWLLLGGLVLLNLFISWWNARMVGIVWTEAKEMGGLSRLVVWAGAVMSASGFAWCYTIIFLLGAYGTQPLWIEGARKALESPEMAQLITQETMLAGLQLGYIVLIPGILLSGMVIWIYSLVVAWRRRDLPSLGVAAWNTYAQYHNTMSAMRGMPEAWRGASSLFSGRNSKGAGGLIVILIVLSSVILGILTTWAIVNHYAGRAKLPAQREVVA